MYQRTLASTSIPNAGTVSQTIFVPRGRSLCAIILPAALTGTALTMQASFDGITFTPVYNQSSVVSITVAANRYILLDPSVFQGIEQLQLVSGSAEAAERTIQLVFTD